MAIPRIRLVASFVGVLTGGLLAVGPVTADMISLNFGADNRTTGPGDAIGTGTAGAPAVATNTWNDYVGPGKASAAAGTVKDSNGSTLANFSFAFTSGNRDTFNKNSTNADVRLFSGFTDASNVVTLTNIPYAQYDVYVYYNGFSANVVNTFVAKDASNNTLDTEYSARGTNASSTMVTTSGYVLGEFASAADAQTVANGANGADYFTYNGLSASTLTISESGSGNVGISGIQIVNTAPTPEPASLGLLAFGGLGLIARRRKA